MNPIQIDTIIFFDLKYVLDSMYLWIIIEPAEQDVIISLVMIPASIKAAQTAFIITQIKDLQEIIYEN